MVTFLLRRMVFRRPSCFLLNDLKYFTCRLFFITPSQVHDNILIMLSLSIQLLIIIKVPPCSNVDKIWKNSTHLTFPDISTFLDNCICVRIRNCEISKLRHFSTFHDFIINKLIFWVHVIYIYTIIL